MSATYWVLVSDELMETGLRWPEGLRPVHPDDRAPAYLGTRWWKFEDDDAPAALDGKKVELVFRMENGEPLIAERRLVT